MTKSHFIAEIYLHRIKERMRNDMALDDDLRRLIANVAREEADLAEQYNIHFDPETTTDQ